MKTTKEIIGLPIISISDGIEVGHVKDIIFNAGKGAIDYLIVDVGIQALNSKVIQVSDVLAIGENAVTIEDSRVIDDTGKLPAAIDLLQKNVQVIGTKIFTKKGRHIGFVVEFAVDEDANCEIKTIAYVQNLEDKTPPRSINYDLVITYGKSVVIVQDNIEALHSSGPFVHTAHPVRASFHEEPKMESSAALLFEERQRQYLKGKVLTKTIMDGEGQIIFSEGTMIDDVVIEVAKQKGKFIEITMNNKAG